MTRAERLTGEDEHANVPARTEQVVHVGARAAVLFDRLRNKVSPRTYLCRYSKWRLTHSVSFYTELVPWPTDSTEHVPRPHTHTQRGITAHLSCSHTPCCCCIPNKQEEGVERATDCDWVGDPWRGLPTGNSTAFLCLSATASYYPSNFPSPLPGLLMHPIIGASHDYGNVSSCNPAFFPDTSIQAMIVIHKGMGVLTLFILNTLEHLIEMSHYERGTDFYYYFGWLAYI